MYGFDKNIVSHLHMLHFWLNTYLDLNGAASDFNTKTDLLWFEFADADSNLEQLNHAIDIFVLKRHDFQKLKKLAKLKSCLKQLGDETLIKINPSNNLIISCWIELEMVYNFFY